MNKIIFYLSLIFMVFRGINMHSQEKLQNKFYELTVPRNTDFKIFDSSHEELANIDVYQFIQDQKPKYILYLMSNKMNTVSENINIDNYNCYLFDLGDLKITDVESDDNRIKLYFSYKNNDNVKGIIYMSITKSVLDRFVFLLPNEKVLRLYQNEIDELVNGIHRLKIDW